MTPLATYLATHPTLTDAEMDHAAALAMGLPVCSDGKCVTNHWSVILASDDMPIDIYGTQIGTCDDAGNASLWSPSTDPAQALELLRAAASKTGWIADMLVMPNGDTLVTFIGCPAKPRRPRAPMPAAVTAACLEAFRAGRGA